MGWGDKAHLECFTTMAWLGGRHPGLRWGTMVCGQAFRNPGYLAKLAVNMHVLTERALYSRIGAGNNGAEQSNMDSPFHPLPSDWSRRRRRSDRPGALEREPGDGPWPALPGERVLFAAAGPADPAHDRRRGRAADTAPRRTLRRLVVR